MKSSILALLLFCCVVGALGFRAGTKLNIPGQPDEQHWALRDFRDAIYYPVRALLDGNNPYNPRAHVEAYPVGDRFTVYSPHTLLLHLPFGLLPHREAGLVYFALSVVLTIVFAHLTLVVCRLEPTTTRMFGVAAVLLMSRPGHWNLLLGQYTLTVSIGCYLALFYARSRPWIAGLGLALAAVKPTFGVPIAFFLLCRKDFRAFSIGAGVSILLALVVSAVLVRDAGGPHAFVTSLVHDYLEFNSDPDIGALQAAFRVDVVALVVKIAGVRLGIIGEFLITVSVLAVVGLGVHRLAQNGSETGRFWSACLALLGTIACIYHQSYDLIFLALPATALILSPTARKLDPRFRMTMLVLLCIPAVNYLSSATAIDALGMTGAAHTIVTSLNRLAILAALLILSAAALRRSPALQGERGASS